MKTLVSLFILLLISFNSNAQSQDWKQIDSPLRTSIEVLHQTSHGYLFGQMNLTMQNYFSKDMGESWSLMPEDFSYIIREDHNGAIYYTSDYGIYTFDTTTLQSHIFINVLTPLDISFLKNGNFVVATHRELYLFSEQGAIIKEHKWFTHSAKILLDSTNQKHFVTNSLGATDFLLEFNDNLSYISDKRTIYHAELYRRGGRIFSENSYSDDGINWTNFNFPAHTYINEFNLGMNGLLFYSSGSKLFISNNDGASFNETILPSPRAEYISSDKNGVIVMSHAFFSDPELYISEDYGESWRFVTSSLSITYSEELTVGREENLYIMRPSQNRYFKEYEWSFWQEDTIKLPSGIRLNNPMSLSNGANIALSNDNRIFETKDRGKSWELYSDKFLWSPMPQGIEEKSDALYIYDRNRLYYSNDFGKIWNTYQTTDQDIISSFRDPYLHTVDNSIFMFNSSSTVNELIFYNFGTGEKIINNGLENTISFASSFYDQSLYVLTNNQQSFYFNFSIDKGSSFSTKLIPNLISGQYHIIKTDHLNNIYIYTNKQVLYSDNQGASWKDISPDFPELLSINNLVTSFDNFIYITTVGMGILKYNTQLKQPKKLTVSVHDDENKTCSVDHGEATFNSMKLLLNGSSIQPANHLGVATFYTHTAINQVTVIYNNDLYEECASSYLIEFEDTDTELHLDIPLKVLKYCADPVVGLSVPFLRRCFDNAYYGSVCNEGNIESINTEIEITLDPFFDFISASLPIKSINGQTLVLDAGHIQPGDCQSFHFVVNVNCDSELGQEHCISAYTSTDSEDCGVIPTARDAYVDCQENIGAYDPNDKNIFVNGNRNQTYIEPGDKIEYLIRFQNTGTDTAFTVRIEDPITKKFNVSSLKPVAASHDYTWSVDNGMLVVLFEDIQLVDSFKNEPASHGFIKFEIQLDSLTIRGDDVKNLAGIFFDFNEAIITEEVVTVIGQPLNTKEQSFETITAFPNPANGLVYISGEALSDKPQDLMIYDIHGKLILSQKISHYSNSIDISKCAPGTYMLMMKSGDKVFRGKLLKM